VTSERFDFLKGETVNQLWFWGTIRLVFDRPSESSWSVDVQDIRLTDADGSAWVIDANGPPLETAPILRLLKQVVTEATAEGSVLRLRFASGMTLEALPDDRYESWSVSGPNGTTQCLPGGELGRW
jgi:Family of unknown function (DUF6188)